MKKILTTIVLTALAAFLLAGCCMSHDWQEANCLAPKTCAKCGATEGEPLEHSWQAASCEAPETCALCSETRGEALGHTWEPADCVRPERCACGAEQGDALGHKIVHNGEALMYSEVPGYEDIGHGIVHTGDCELCGEQGSVFYNDWANFINAFLPGTWRLDVAIYITTLESYDLSEGGFTVQIYPDGKSEYSTDETVLHYDYVFAGATQISEPDTYPTSYNLYGHLVNSDGTMSDVFTITSTALEELTLINSEYATICHSLDYPYVPGA